MESGSPPIEEVKQRWTYPFWAPQSWVKSDPCLSSSLELFHRLRVVFVEHSSPVGLSPAHREGTAIAQSRRGRHRYRKGGASMTDRIGQQLGNYTIVQLLGRGGFADVYLAEHIYLKTQVAVKVLQTRLSTAQDMNSFLQEAQLIARLSHPHIVRVLDFGLDGEIPFLVMDYAPNGTLRQHHPKGTPLPLALIISYVKQLADALHYAHGEKVIHRDIKPENMLFGKRHEVLLSDFGVALAAQSSRYQGTQDVAGTVGYMSPEQIQGKARPASDQYSLGIVVYEWVSGDRPFHGSFTEVCTQHLFAPLPSLKEKVPGILPQVEQVITLALAKDLKQRFGSIQAFARALEQASQSAEPTGVVSLSSSPPAPATAQSEPPQAQLEEIAMSAPASLEPEASLTPPPASPPSETPAPTPPPQKEPEEAHLLHQPSGVPANMASLGSAWSIGRRQIVALLVGIALFSLVSYLVDLFFAAASNNGFSSPPYQPFWPFGGGGLSLLNIALAFSLILPAFFAARFGPWVGLGSALFGDVLGNALSGTLSASFNPWYTYITYAIFGFMAGLAFVRTRGHYNTRGALLSLAVINVVGLVLSLVWQSIGDSSFNPPAPVTSFYLPLALVYCLPGLLLLVCLLIVYERVAPHKS
jgi:serine/threonine protein kinase